MYAQKSALDAFTGLTRADILLLHKLYHSSRPLPYGLFYDLLALECVSFGKKSFIAALSKLVQRDVIRRQRAGKYVLFNITIEGKLLLSQFNATFDSIVKEQIMKYGNGLPE